MDLAFENRMQEIIQRDSATAAIQEWIDAQKNSKEPLYNYRFDHVKLVVQLSKQIARNTNANMDIITMAGWLHDAAKPGVGGVIKHGELSAEMARKILSDEEIDSKIVERVCHSIRKHAGLTLDEPLESLEAQILWDADKLVKLGITGFVHFIVNGIRLHPGMNMLKLSQRIRDFLPLAEEICNSMNTDLGKELARKRLDTIRIISHRLNEELDFGIDKVK